MSGLLFQEKHYYKSMKKFAITLLCLLISAPCVVADDVDMPATGDLWDNWNPREDAREAKPVSDADFDKALEQVDNKVNKWKKRLEKKNLPKGEEFRQSNETEFLNTEHGEQASLPVLCLPFEITLGEGVIPVGHYQLKAEKVDHQLFLNLYQAHYLVAKIPAVETEDDFGEDSIFFAKWLPDEGNRVKIIYGSLEYNAYTIVEITE